MMHVALSYPLALAPSLPYNKGTELSYLFNHCLDNYRNIYSILMVIVLPKFSYCQEVIDFETVLDMFSTYDLISLKQP